MRILTTWVWHVCLESSALLKVMFREQAHCWTSITNCSTRPLKYVHENTGTTCWQLSSDSSSVLRVWHRLLYSRLCLLWTLLTVDNSQPWTVSNAPCILGQKLCLPWTTLSTMDCRHHYMAPRCTFSPYHGQSINFFVCVFFLLCFFFFALFSTQLIILWNNLFVPPLHITTSWKGQWLSFAFWHFLLSKPLNKLQLKNQRYHLFIFPLYSFLFKTSDCSWLCLRWTLCQPWTKCRVHMGVHGRESLLYCVAHNQKNETLIWKLFVDYHTTVLVRESFKRLEVIHTFTRERHLSSQTWRLFSRDWDGWRVIRG